LDVYPAVRIDNTNRNWKKKNIIFSKSDLTLVTPSSWLAQRTRSSFLGHLPVRVIPNGVDLAVFKPGSQTAARNLLNIDPNAFMILFTAAGGRGSAFKDYAMLDRVTKRLQKHKFRQQVILLALGGNKDQHTIVNQVTMIEKPFIKEQGEVAKHYQACDLYIHTAKADNAPLVILEAMACGKPIVSTSAGGIPELVREGETGYTIPMGDDLAMFDRIISLMGNQNRLNQMGAKASKIAQSENGLEQMVSNYLTLYQELIDARSI
jgi:glycosyltransferase involved in cell wall biosynthesis